MSIGNLPTQGDKKNNFAYQLGVLRLLESIVNNTSVGPGMDYELITFYYKANKNGAGYSTGDEITRTQIVAVPTGAIVSTLWFNQSTGLTIAAPPIADIDPVQPSTSVTVNNLPAILGQANMANSLAVVIASNQTAIPVSNPNLDVALSTLSMESTQLLIKALLTTIQSETANLDVLSSTRASEASLLNVLTTTAFQARINTLGQKTMAASTPVVISSDQSALNVLLSSLPLPAGAATEATLLAIDALLTAKLDVALSTRNAEATQLLIKAKTDNLDVLLSTRASEATLSTRATEATLALIKAKTDNLDVLLSTRNAEATQLLVKAKTDNLDVLLSTRASETTLSSINTKLTGSSRTPSVVVATVNGSTIAGRQSVSFLFMGSNGTLDGVTVPNGFTASFAPNHEEDTLASIPYTVPTTGALEIIITYVI